MAKVIYPTLATPSVINWEADDVVDALTYSATGLSGRTITSVSIDEVIDLYKPPEPSILEKYTVSNNVQFHIVDTPGGYSLQLVIDNLVVYKEEIAGNILNGKRRVIDLPIIAAIKKEYRGE